jgi:hypothetical protein
VARGCDAAATGSESRSGPMTELGQSGILGRSACGAQQTWQNNDVR